MNQKTQAIEINLTDLLFAIVKKIGFVLLAGLIVAGVMFGYKAFTGTNDANVLDVSVRFDDETDTEYAERVLNANRAKDLVNSIQALNNQIENQREYVANSILMQINAENEAVTSAIVIVTVPESIPAGVDLALVSSYSQDILSGEYLESLANEMNINRGYLTELISIDDDSQNVEIAVSGENGSAKAFLITVIGTDTNITSKIMDAILDEVVSQNAALSQTMAEHSVTVSGRQDSFMVDSKTRESQYTATNRFEVLQKQIKTYDDSLVEVASKLGVSGKDSITAFYLYGDSDKGSGSLVSAVKYAIMGFMVGAFVTVILFAVQYIFGKKLLTQAQLFTRFQQLYKIGVLKPSGKHSGFVQFIERKSGDDTTLSKEDNCKLISANLKNVTLDMDKVLFTGTAETDKIKEIAKLLNAKVDIKPSVFDEPDTLENVSQFDGVVLVEQRSYSNLKLIAEEIRLISSAKTKLIGVIVI